MVKNIRGIYLEAIDTEEHWNASTIVLKKGQKAFVEDKLGWYKIGDGIHTFKDLEYIKNLESNVNTLTTAVTVLTRSIGVSGTSSDIDSKITNVIDGSIVTTTDEEISGLE